MLAANGPASLQDGGTLPLSIVRGGGSSFATCAGGAQVLRGGTYLVGYTLNAPAGSVAGALLGLRLNGVRLSESETTVQLAGSAQAAAFSGQTVINACAGSCISVVCNGTATFPQGAPLLTMTLVRISP